MPDHNRKVDDLDYLLRGALWSSQNSAPDPARVFAARRALVAGNAGLVKFSDGGLMLVFGAADAGATLVPTVTLKGGDYRTTLVRPSQVVPHALL